MSVAFTAQWHTAGSLVFGEDISMRTANAAVILSLIGYPERAKQAGSCLGVPTLPDAFGELPGEDFLGRVVVARALLDAAADDEHGLPGWSEGGEGTGRARVIDLGREPGRLAELLDELETIARDAQAHGGIVAWG